VDDNLVTLAIHTFRKADEIKTFLESEGVGVYLQNINPIRPVVSAGVRVRISETDLPRALSLIENSEFSGDIDPRTKLRKEKRVLIPVDFSDYSVHACETGFEYASRAGLKVDILHVFLSPTQTESPLWGESFVMQGKNEEKNAAFVNEAREEFRRFEAFVKQQIADGRWADAQFNCIFREGLPEEEITAWCDEFYPALVVMGTRGKSRKGAELIGSVTAEVLETVRVPLLAIPEKTPFRHLSDVRRIAFGTNFGQKDLIAFDNLVKLLSNYEIEYCLFHLTNRPDVWSEIKLAGIKEYFSAQYQNIPIRYSIIDTKNYFILPLDRFIRQENIDIIALPIYRRNILSRLFNSGTARKMLFHTDTPVFAVRG